MLIWLPLFALAQYSDEQMYEAYLSGDVSLWGDYIAHCVWDSLDDTERTRLINYEYGYIPVQADKKDPQCRQLLDNYKRHLEAHKSVLPPSLYTAYTSSAHAYEYLLDKSKLLSEGLQSFKKAKRSVELNPHDPIALSLMGNVSFYAPSLFGGSKKKAMEMFLEAEQIMSNDSAFRYMWNYPALQLCIAQCYEKRGDKHKAIQQCKRIVERHPHFLYVTDDYLPQLQRQ